MTRLTEEDREAFFHGVCTTSWRDAEAMCDAICKVAERILARRASGEGEGRACPECGPTHCDEDGCCLTCGADVPAAHSPPQPPGDFAHMGDPYDADGFPKHPPQPWWPWKGEAGPPYDALVAEATALRDALEAADEYLHAFDQRNNWIEESNRGDADPEDVERAEKRCREAWQKYLRLSRARLAGKGESDG